MEKEDKKKISPKNVKTAERRLTEARRRLDRTDWAGNYPADR